MEDLEDAVASGRTGWINGSHTAVDVPILELRGVVSGVLRPVSLCFAWILAHGID